MADPYYKKTPYGWCCDHPLEPSIYHKMSWQEYVEMLEKWLNERGVNYSVVHYKTMVRVHVYFSAIKKMGFDDAVELYWLSRKETDYMKLLGRPGWTYDNVKHHVREYFLKNDLELPQEKHGL